MAQADLESLVGGGGGGDAKVACETLLADPPAEDPPSTNDPDFPPESFLVPIDDEIDWVGAGAVYYERDDSTKGNTNPKSQHGHGGGGAAAAAVTSSRPRSNSLRFSGNLQAKVPIIGLPGAVQHSSGYVGRSARFPTSARIFPKKPTPAADRGRKSAVPDHEPSSPKVSCIGKVLSQRERERRRRNHRERLPEVTKSEPEPTGKIGCWAGVAGAFRCYRGGGGAVGGERAGAHVGEETPASSASPPSEAAGKRPPSPEKSEASSAPAPALGAMTKFASGRKSATWEDELALGAAGGTRGAVGGGGGSTA